MRKYIQPRVDIHAYEFTLLAGLSKNDNEGSDDEFGNTATFDDGDYAGLSTGKNLWED